MSKNAYQLNIIRKIKTRKKLVNNIKIFLIKKNKTVVNVTKISQKMKKTG